MTNRMGGAPVLVGAIASFQVGASVAKSLFPALGASGTVGLRIALSTVLLWIIWRPWRSLAGLAPVSLLRAILPYGLSLGLMNLLFYLALARLPLGIAVAIEFSGPLALAFLGSRRLLDLVWACLVVAGLALLLMTPWSLHGLDRVGVGFALGAALCWALYIMASQRIARRLRSGPAAALGMVAASVAIVPFCLPAMMPALHRPSLLLAAVAVAVLSGALPYTLELIALRRMSARGYGILSSLDPVLAALSGLLLLGERLWPLHWLGIGCIVIASAGSALAGDPVVVAEA